MRKSMVLLATIMCTVLLGIIVLQKDAKEPGDFFSDNELRQLEQTLEKELIIEIGKQLFYEDYAFGLEWEAMSQEEIHITVRFPSGKVSSTLEEDVRGTIEAVIEESDYDPSIFTIDITTYELERIGTILFPLTLGSPHIKNNPSFI